MSTIYFPLWREYSELAILCIICASVSGISTALGTHLKLRRPINSIHHNTALVKPCPVKSVPETSNLHVLPGISTTAGTSQGQQEKRRWNQPYGASMASLLSTIGRIGVNRLVR